MSLGGDDRKLGRKLRPSLDSKENKEMKEKGMPKETDSHMTEKINPVEVDNPLFSRGVDATV